MTLYCWILWRCHRRLANVLPLDAVHHAQEVNKILQEEEGHILSLSQERRFWARAFNLPALLLGIPLAFLFWVIIGALVIMGVL